MVSGLASGVCTCRCCVWSCIMSWIGLFNNANRCKKEVIHGIDVINKPSMKQFMICYGLDGACRKSDLHSTIDFIVFHFT